MATAPRNFPFAGVRVPTALLALGTIILGDPGCGKSVMIKHFLDAIIGHVLTIKNTVIIDFKGDLSQIVKAAVGVHDQTYDDVFFEIMTFGSGVGTFATLTGFDKRLGQLERIDISGAGPLAHREKSRFTSLAKALAKDVLLDIIVQKRDGTDRLGGDIEMPSAKERRTMFGTLTAKDDEMFATRLYMVVVQVFMKCRHAGVALPRGYDELLAELRCAYDPRCRNAEPAVAIDKTSLDQGDLDTLATSLASRVADPSWAALYLPETDAGPDAKVALSGDRLLAKPPVGKRRRVTVVNCALYGLPGVDDAARRTIASTVICRMEQKAAGAADGSQEAPTSMLVIDEASFVMPQSAAKATGPDVASVAAVKKLLKLHRDKGMAVVLATQRPKDLHGDIRSCVTGLRMIGSFKGEKSEEKMLLDSIVKDNALRKETRKQVGELDKHEFLMVKDGELRRVKAKKLKRLHESSAPWCQLDEFTLEDLMSEDAEVSAAAIQSHPLAEFTRNVRMRAA